MRVGIGFDVHAFVESRSLVLGGVTIPHDRGLAGHSDADVLSHALMDALLSAMRLGDIGAHFPDRDPRFAGADSIGLLEHVGALMRDEGWCLVDADTVLVLERPRVSPYRDQMRERLAEALAVPIGSIGVKATTTEGLGFPGREEGVAAYAVVLIDRATASRSAR
ncbi:MAG TPA: 2-C-methyl-D-erythritol 2,4-cyclodiphosphate synthase [Coriobacteriia bacterium]|nr:2-C-methyl-D-erythritol 2,4-cyclodiphosphate synthase [Coriobacteriia bacterium]